jgi:hypothetical protein
VIVPKSFILSTFVTLLVLISACKPFVISTPPPPPQTVQVAYSSTLRPYVGRLHQCGIEHPEIALITQETSHIALGSNESDLTLWFGEPSRDFPGIAFSLGMDAIVLVAGADVVQTKLNSDQLTELYSTPNSAYHVWGYSQENELRQIFDHTVLDGKSTAADMMITPNPKAMVEAITGDPMAIGYLPESWLSGDLQKLSMDPDLQESLTHPILALTASEPEGRLRAYLICLQNSTP